MNKYQLVELIGDIVKESIEKYNSQKIISESNTNDIEIMLRSQPQIEKVFNVKIDEIDRGALYSYPTAEPGMAWNMKDRRFVPCLDMRVYKAGINEENFKELYSDAISDKSVISKILNNCKHVSKSKVGKYNGYIEKLSNVDEKGSSIINYQFTKMFVVYSDIEDPLVFQKLSYAKEYCQKVGIFEKNNNLNIEESK